VHGARVLHGRPRAQRLADGDLVTLDLAVSPDGVAADSAVSVVVGHAAPEAAALIAATERALAAGIAAVRPGLLLALEPWVMADTDELVTDPDGWTLRSATGCATAHSEHTVLVTDDGVEILTLPPRRG